MGLFRKKCEYCRNKIKKGDEIIRYVKDPVFIKIKQKAFCSKEHADNYEYEVSHEETCKSSCCATK